MLNELADGIAPVYARERLARYFDLAGFPEAAQSYRDTLAQGSYVPYEPPVTSGAGKELERALNDLLYEVWPGLNAAMNEQSPTTCTPWAPDWVMSPEERRYYEGACSPCGSCGVGFHHGHYLLSDKYQRHCYMRQPECLPPRRSQEACLGAYCEECVIGAAARFVQYEWTSRSNVIAREMQRLQLARQWYGTLRPEGHALLEAEAAEIPQDELHALHVYWDLLVEAAIGSYEESVDREVGLPRLTLGDLIASSSDLRECATRGGTGSRAQGRCGGTARCQAPSLAGTPAARSVPIWHLLELVPAPGSIGIEINPRTSRSRRST